MLDNEAQSDEWLEIANSHVDQGRWDEAVEACHKALKSEPHNLAVRGEVISKPEVCLQIGLFLLSRNEVERAIQYFHKSIELAPGRWESHMSLGRAYMQIGFDREAEEQFEEVLRLSPEEAGLAYETLGEMFARKKGNLRAAGRTEPSFKQALKIYLDRRLLEDATRVVLRLLDFRPESCERHRWLAELYVKQSRLAEAVEAYRVLVGLYPDDSPQDEVIDLYETVVSLDSSARWAVDALIDLYESVLESDATNESFRDRLEKLATIRMRVE